MQGFTYPDRIYVKNNTSTLSSECKFTDFRGNKSSFKLLKQILVFVFISFCFHLTYLDAQNEAEFNFIDQSEIIERLDFELPKNPYYVVTVDGPAALSMVLPNGVIVGDEYGIELSEEIKDGFLIGDISEKMQKLIFPEDDVFYMPSGLVMEKSERNQSGVTFQQIIFSDQIFDDISEMKLSLIALDADVIHVDFHEIVDGALIREASYTGSMKSGQLFLLDSNAFGIKSAGKRSTSNRKEEKTEKASVKDIVDSRRSSTSPKKQAAKKQATIAKLEAELIAEQPTEKEDVEPAVKSFVSEKAKPSIGHSRAKSVVEKLLVFGVKQSNVSKVKRALQQGAEVGNLTVSNFNNTNGETIETEEPLLIASILQGNFELFKLLVAQGADCGQTAKEEELGVTASPLILSAMTGNLDFVKYIVEECGEDPSKYDKQETTPLLAALSGNEKTINRDLIKYLVETVGMDVNQVNQWNWTPFALAYAKGLEEEAKYLFFNGADPTIAPIQRTNGIVYKPIKIEDYLEDSASTILFDEFDFEGSFSKLKAGLRINRNGEINLDLPKVDQNGQFNLSLSFDEAKMKDAACNTDVHASIYFDAFQIDVTHQSDFVKILISHPNPENPGTKKEYEHRVELTDISEDLILSFSAQDQYLHINAGISQLDPKFEMPLEFDPSFSIKANCSITLTDAEFSSINLF